jgi:hypothetical protein
VAKAMSTPFDATPCGRDTWKTTLGRTVLVRRLDASEGPTARSAMFVSKDASAQMSPQQQHQLILATTSSSDTTTA